MLPTFNTKILELSLMQSQWGAQLNPLIDAPFLKGIILPSVSLAIGANVISHRLGRKLQGWALVDINGAAQIYRSAAKNDLTLTLTSDAAVLCDLYVF